MVCKVLALSNITKHTLIHSSPTDFHSLRSHFPLPSFFALTFPRVSHLTFSPLSLNPDPSNLCAITLSYFVSAWFFSHRPGINIIFAMAAIASVGRNAVTGSSHRLRAMEILRGPSSIEKGLPANHPHFQFTSLKQLEDAATVVFDLLHENEGQGNQFLLVHNVPRDVIELLVNNKNALRSIPFRLQWFNGKALIKVVPGYSHDSITHAFSSRIDRVWLSATPDEGRWGGTSTYTFTSGGKQGDQIFWPTSREPFGGLPPGWPTLVVETGVSESRPRLLEDVKTWFNESRGLVRIVITIKILRHSVELKKWQLLPPGAPNPAPRQYVANLKTQPGLMPALAQQAAANQQIFALQDIVVTRNGVQGAPLIIPFFALMDRQPRQNERDITFTAADILWLTRDVAL